MLRFEEILLDAERELDSTQGLKRAVQFSIVYALVRQAVQTYTRSDAPETSQTALSLMQMLLDSGAITTVLHSAEESVAPTREAARPSTPTPTGEMGIDAIRKLAKQLHLTEEESDALVRSAGFLDEDERAVISRTDEDLAREELFRSNPLNGVAGFAEPPADYTSRDGDDLTGVTQ